MDKQRILIVDDDPVIALSCKKVLGVEGYTVFTAEDGESAIRKVTDETFDLVITDVRLPDVNGFAIVRESRIVQPSADIMVISGYPSLEDAREATRLGAFEYLEKPFTPDFMLHAVKKIFDKKGWILRKAYIDQFKKYIVPTSELDDLTVYYKDGTWARPLIKEEVWEIGMDVRHFLVSGQLMYVEMMKQVKVLAAGEPFARLISSDGRTVEITSPMAGTVKMFNERANEAISSLAKNYASEGWQLWLARILSPSNRQ
jgi:DNA-binding response OmpR family regulator